MAAKCVPAVTFSNIVDLCLTRSCIFRSVDAEREWLQKLCGGLRNLVEGGHKALQLHLLAEDAVINMNINFVTGTHVFVARQNQVVLSYAGATIF